ncbi:PEP-CTERM sorting domain-containing protein [Tautonia marina]|uniref:PEP-CTERM sorting domain-containing protein n=1 Tax=Tautonia marina TaxID=2653855 RepID=UPI0013761047|nr:PEP-CTERM sorting domain-containing protein [Tautonia marina]
MSALVQQRLQSFGTLRLVAAMGVLLLAPGVASAYPLSVTRTTTGTTGSNTELVWNPAAGVWSDGGFSITTMVEKDGTQLVGSDLFQVFKYTYSITTPLVGGNLSHVVVQLSQNILDDQWGIFGVNLNNFTFDGDSLNNSIKTHTEAQGNPGMPADLFGIKLNIADTNPASFSFRSLQTPVWGNFYAKDGGGTGDGAVWAHNKDFLSTPSPLDVTAANVDSGDFAGYVITADTARVIVPEPSTFAIAGLSGLAMLGYSLRRRKLARA